MNRKFLFSLLFSILFNESASFTSVKRNSRTSTPSCSQAESDSSLNLLPQSFSVVTTVVGNKVPISSKSSRSNTELISSQDSYVDVQRPIFSFTDNSNVLTPAVEGVRQVVSETKSAVSNVAQTASKLGVSFGLSYSMLSNINGGVTLAISWYMTCQRTGVSPVYQWKALLKSYAAMYAFLQALKPVRIVAAISMARHTERLLEATQERFQCGKSKAVALQYACGYVAQAIVASVGVCIASTASGVPIFASP